MSTKIVIDLGPYPEAEASTLKVDIRLLLRDALGEFVDARKNVEHYVTKRYPPDSMSRAGRERKIREVSGRIACARRIARGDVTVEVDTTAPRVFVAWPDGTFTCPDCTPRDLDLGDDSVNTWLEGSDGWTAPIVCRDCRTSIPVIVNGEEKA